MHALVVHDGSGDAQVILLNGEVEVEPWLLAHPQFDGLLYTSLVVDDRLAGLPDEFPWEDLDTGPLLAADGTFNGMFSGSEQYRKLYTGRGGE